MSVDTLLTQQDALVISWSRVPESPGGGAGGLWTCSFSLRVSVYVLRSTLVLDSTCVKPVRVSLTP